MPVYFNKDGKLKKLGLIPLNKEKDLQKLVEENLQETLDMFFLASEYPTTHGGRIDTLAIDSKGAPVIIEYKRNKHDNVITQALFYLNWLKSQKSEFFEMLIVKKFGAEKAKFIDWKNPRAICIAESYNPYDIFALNEISNLELHKFRYYENNIFTLENVKGEDEKLSIIEDRFQEKKESNIPSENTQKRSERNTNADFEKVSEINLKRQINKGQQFVKDLFGKLQVKILELDESIYQKVNNNNIAFRISKMFAEVHIQKSDIVIYLRPIEYDDPAGAVFRVPDTHRWTLNRGVRIKDESELTYIMPFIEQSYKDVL